MTKRERDIRKINLVIGLLALLVIFAITYFILYDSGTSAKVPDVVVAGVKDKKPEQPPGEAKGQEKTEEVSDDLPPEVKGPYKLIQERFEGKPDEALIKQKMDAVMKRHQTEITEASLLRFANMLVALRQNSQAGIKEIEILEHMLEHGEGSNSLQVQAVFSKSALERARR